MGFITLITMRRKWFKCDCRAEGFCIKCGGRRKYVREVDEWDDAQRRMSALGAKYGGQMAPHVEARILERDLLRRDSDDWDLEDIRLRRKEPRAKYYELTDRVITVMPKRAAKKKRVRGSEGLAGSIY